MGRMNIGVIGGIAGSILGLAGGVAGAYRAYRRAKGPRERRFVVWASTALLGCVALYLTALFLAPKVRAAVFMAYAVVLSITIISMNRRHGIIQREEHSE
jgi:hypothetical protein